MNSQLFIGQSITLHSDLLNGLGLLCQDKQMEQIKKLEASVQLCIRSLHDLYVILPTDGFESGEDEIRFFKYTKPLFAAEREYYQRLYHGCMFGETNPGFWAHEKKRMEKLLAQHSDFVCYYHGGEAHNDAVWFSQGQAPLPTPLCMWQWETNPKHTSARDGWVAGVMAVERYMVWLNSKIDNVEKAMTK
jgi:hypothetical protein